MNPDNFEPLDYANLITDTLCTVSKFTASWCGPCKSKEFNDNYKILKEKFSFDEKIIKFLEFDIDAFEELINDKEYYDIQINQVPTFKITYKGEWIKTFKGASCIQEVNDLLEQIFKKMQSEKDKNLDGTT